MYECLNLSLNFIVCAHSPFDIIHAKAAERIHAASDTTHSIDYE